MADLLELLDRKIVLDRLRGLRNSGDPEAAHAAADAALCSLLLDLGYEDVVEAWKLVPKWHA